MATITASVAGGNSNTNGAWVGSVQPTASDDVLLTATSGPITIPASTTMVCRSIDCTGYTGTFTFSATTSVLTIGDASGGKATFVSGMTLTLTGIGTINFVATTASTTYALTTGGKVMPNLTVNTGTTTTIQFADAVTATSAGVTLAQGKLDTNGKTVSSGSYNSTTSNTRTLTMGATVWTITGGGTAWNVTTTNYTITSNTAALTLSGSSVTCTPGNVSQQGASISFTGTGACVLGGAATWAAVTRTGTASVSDELQLSSSPTITGAFTVNSNSLTNRVYIRSSAIGTPRTISAGSLVCTNVVDWRDITTAGAATWTVAGSGATDFSDCGGNTGITFAASKTRYAFAGATKNFTSTTMWDAVSTTGGGGASVPLSHDDIVFDSGTGAGTYTINMPRPCRNLTCTGFTRTLASNTAYSIFGNITLGSGMTLTASNALTLEGRGTHTITSAGKSYSAGHQQNGPGGTYTLQDAYTYASANALQISQGTFDTGGFTVTIGSMLSNGSQTRSLTLGASTVNLTDTAAASTWNTVSTLTLSAASSTIVFTNTSTNSRTFAGGGLTFGTLTYTVASSPGALVITGATTIATLNIGSGRHVTFPSSTTTTVTTWNVNGANNGYVYLPGVSGSYISTPDAAANSITGDLTIDAKVRMNDWTPAANTELVAKWATAAATDLAYALAIDTTGKVLLAYSTTGTNVLTATSTVATGATDGTDLWVRACRTSSTGTVRFYTSPDGSTWSQLGTSVAGTSGNLFDNARALELGSDQGGAQSLLAGRIYNAKLYNSDLGSGSGTPAQSFDASLHTTGTDTYTASTGEVWTLNGQAKEGDGRVIVDASTSGTAATVSKTSGVVSSDYLTVKDSTATGGATFYAGSHSTNVSGNTGWIFADYVLISSSDTGSGTDTATIAATVSDTDTGSGAEGTPTIGVASPDTGAGEEGTPRITLGAEDTGVGTDAAMLAATLSSTDVGSGADAVVSIALASTDVGSGVDAVTRIALADTETGSGIEGTPGVALASTDTGSGADAVVSIGLTAADTGTGADAVVRIALAATDLGSGAEGTPSVALTSTDLGAGADAATLNATVAASDLGSGVEGTVGIALAATDLGAGTDTASLSAVVTGADTGSGTEGAPLVGTGGSDTSTGLDTGTVNATVTSTDTGAGAETTVGIALGSADVGTGADAETLTSTVTSSDTGAGVDAVTRITLTAGEVGAGLDVGLILAALTSADTGSGIDMATLIGLAAADLGHGLDTAVQIALAAGDTATAVEAATIVIVTISVATRVIVHAVRNGTVTYLAVAPLIDLIAAVQRRAVEIIAARDSFTV